MPLTITEIIAEADVRVQNVFTPAQKVNWLNEVNRTFFELVKIPKTYVFDAVSEQQTYIIPSHIRSKNINRLMVGTTVFLSEQYEISLPGRNIWMLDDDTHELTIIPVPKHQLQTAILSYSKIGTTNYTTSNMSATPDAPEEYHWIYILGLCEKIAKAMDDVGKGNNYASDFQAQLLVAQQNYLKGG